MKNSFTIKTGLTAMMVILISGSLFAQKKENKASLVKQIKELTAGNTLKLLIL